MGVLGFLMATQHHFSFLPDDSATLADRLSRIRNTQLTTLYQLGLLRIEHLKALFEILTHVPYLFRVRYNNRIVKIFTVSNTNEADQNGTSNWEFSHNGFVRYRSPDCELFVKRHSTVSRNWANDLCQHAGLIIHNTLVWRSLQKERLNALSADLRKALTESQELNIDKLAVFISRRLSVSIALVEKRTERLDYRTGRSFGEKVEYQRSRSREKTEKSIATTAYVLRRMKSGRFFERGFEVQRALSEKAGLALRGGKLIEVSGEEIGGSVTSTGSAILFPLCRSTEPKSQRNQLFLVSGRRNDIGQDDIHIIQELISYYFDHLLRGRQQQVLTGIAKDINELHRKPIFDLNRMEEEYEATVEAIVREVIWTTPSYRCSIWEYSPKFHALIPKKVLAYKGGVVAKPPKFFSQAISIHQFDRSSIVNCFSSALLTEASIYIGDVRKPERYIRASGGGRELKRIIAPGDYTQSEISVPLFEAGAPVGVLYAESRLIDAYDSELWYFQAIGSLLSELRTSQNRRMDASFVAEKLSLFDSLHDLGPQVDVILKDQPDLRKWVRDFFELDRTEDPLSGRLIVLNFREAVDSLRQEFSYQLRDTMDEVFSSIKVRANVPIFRTLERTSISFRFILKNLISNAFRYRVQQFSSSLTIAFDRPRGIVVTRAQQEAGQGLVRIEYTIEPPLPESLVRQLGKRSIAAAGRAPRRGLYLVGLVTRQLGGTFHATSSVDQRRTRIVLRIPLSNEGGLEGDRNCLPGT
jgi:hypothetical protein